MWEKIDKVFPQIKLQTTCLMTDIEQNRRKVTRAKYGTVFFTSSFPETNAKYASRMLSEFEVDGLLVKMSNGVYLKARKTRFGYSYPPISDVIAEIAKRDKAQIIPSGETAANQMGFSTQVPMNVCYLTSGSYRRLTLGNRQILLKHAAPKAFEYKLPEICTLVQALKSIKQNNIQQGHITIIRHVVDGVKDQQKLSHDIRLAPQWIQQLILQSKKTS